MQLIVFANYNGADVLPHMLERLTQVTPPKGGWAIVAVDNASSDKSLSILQQYRGRLPLTILTERRRGKNQALNRALDSLGARLAEAELVVFTDSDVLPAHDWLIRLQHAARMHPEVDIFGGTIVPAWMAPPPAWIAEFEPQFGLLYTITQTSDGPCSSSLVWGPNMALRGRVFRSGIRFNPKFGPNGGDEYPMGSETELTRRLEMSGHRSYFVPDARVAHLVRKRQLDEKWILGRAYRAGLGYALLGFPSHAGPRLCGVPPRFAVSLCKASLMRTAARLLRSRRIVRKAHFNMSWHRGVLSGLIVHARRVSAPLAKRASRHASGTFRTGVT